MKTINEQLELLKSHMPQHALKATQVSDASVGWHIDHSLRVIKSVVQRLHDTDPKDYNPPFFNLPRFIVMATGKIPRGKAKAPKAVISKTDIFNIEEMAELLKKTEGLIETIDTLPQNSYFEHPIFGHVNRPKIKRFLEVHTHHHLKIIQDILKAAA